MFSSSGRVLSPSLPNWPHLRTPPSTWPISLSYRLQMIQMHAWEASKDISRSTSRSTRVILVMHGHDFDLGVTQFLLTGTGLVTGCENIFRLVEGYGTAILLCGQPDYHRVSHRFWADLDEKRNEHQNADCIWLCRHDPRCIISSAQPLQIWEKDSNFLLHLDRFPDLSTTKPALHGIKLRLRRQRRQSPQQATREIR
jgi:hypothetical protein